MPHQEGNTVSVPKQPRPPPTFPFHNESKAEIDRLCRSLVASGGYLIVWSWVLNAQGEWTKKPIIGWKGASGSGDKRPADPSDVDIDKGRFPGWAPGMSGCVALDVDTDVDACLAFFDELPDLKYVKVTSAGGRGHHLIFRDQPGRFVDTDSWGIAPPQDNGEVLRYDLRYGAIGSLESLAGVVQAVTRKFELSNVPTGMMVRKKETPVFKTGTRKTKKVKPKTVKPMGLGSSYKEFAPLEACGGNCLVCETEGRGTGTTRFNISHRNLSTGWEGPWCWKCLSSGGAYAGLYARWLGELRDAGILAGLIAPYVDNGLPEDYDAVNLGEAFLAHHEGNIFFDPTVPDGWRFWMDGSWKSHIGDEPVATWVYASLLDEVRFLTRKGKTRHRRVERGRSHLKQLKTSIKPWDQKTGVAGVPGGKVWTAEEGLTKGRKTDFVARRLGAVPADTWKDTRWASFVDEVAGDASGYLRRAMGYALLGDPVEHIFLTLHGGGGNGKSIFMEIVGKAAGDYATTASMEHFLAGANDHPQHVARLRGARYVFGSEAKATGAWKSAVLKSLTGGDTLEARYMRQDSFTFKPQCLLVMAVNSLPRINVVDDAIKRRLRVVPFDFKPDPDKVDKNLFRTLVQELPHVVRWLLDGADEYLAGGLQTPEVVSQATHKYLTEQDTPLRFLEICEQMGPDHRVKRGPVRKAYEAWCKDEGVKPVSPQKFCERLRGAGIQEIRSGMWYWLGIEPPECDENGLILSKNPVDVSETTQNEAVLDTLATLATSYRQAPRARRKRVIKGSSQSSHPSQNADSDVTRKTLIAHDDPRIETDPDIRARYIQQETRDI